MTSICLPRIGVVVLAVFFAVNCARKPTELNGPIKGKLSLRLANGAPISQPGSDEYNPHLILGPNNYLALVFGSNRSCALTCSGHNIFVSMSLTPFDGQSLPFFSAPAVVEYSGSPWVNDTMPVNFVAMLEGSALKIYANTVGDGYRIMVAEVNNTGNIPSPPVAIDNAFHSYSTVIGVDGSGKRLVVLDDATFEAYEIDPAASNQGTRLAAIDYAASAVGVRQENSGLQDGYFASYTAFTFAASKDMFIGPLASLDLSLATSSLYLKTINSFFTSSASNDLVLFTANDGFSDDMYVVTSHTAGELWNTTGFFGFDQFLPPMPDADIRLEFDNNLNVTGLQPSLWGTPTAASVTYVTPQATGTNAASFNGTSSNVSFTSANVGDTFTIATWVKLNSGSGSYTVAANSASGAVSNGFRFYIDLTTNVKLVLETGSGGSGTAAEAATPGFDLFPTGEWHHVAVTVDRLGESVMFYVDGLAYGAGSVLPNFATGPSALRLGSTTDDTNHFSGSMDDTMIFTRVLDPLEIMVLSSVEIYQAPP
ncbi:MAG: LamG domain-containing protein [Spirochaetota bacterium]